MAKVMFHLNCLEQGGAERVVTNLSEQFALDGYEVVVATQWQAENEFTLNKLVKRLHVGLRDMDEKSNRIAKYTKRIKYLKEAIEEEKPDVVIAFAHKANYRALMATLKNKVPVIISVRTDPVGHYDSMSDKILIKWLFKKAAGCVFQTTGQKEFFKDSIGENCKIILNPINPKYLNTKVPDSRTNVIMHVGRLVDFKNQPMLLRAFANIHKKYPEYTLQIYGGDSGDGTKEILEGIIKDLSLESSVTLMGASNSIETQITDGAFFAFTSDWEGLPNALMEAMALGLPCVATDCPCGGPRTIMTSYENGILIPIMDQKALEEGMEYMITHRDKADQMGLQARKISEIANAQTVYEQWKSYVETVRK